MIFITTNKSYEKDPWYYPSCSPVSSDYDLLRISFWGYTMKCPKCQRSMVKRNNRETGDRFWGCSDYPRCKGTIPMVQNKPFRTKYSYRELKWDEILAKQFPDLLHIRENNSFRFTMEGYGVCWLMADYDRLLVKEAEMWIPYAADWLYHKLNNYK